jgi:hypothetical protein
MDDLRSQAQDAFNVRNPDDPNSNNQDTQPEEKGENTNCVTQYIHNIYYNIFNSY